MKKNPPLTGLLLAGGLSRRMGRDKGMIAWHGSEHRYYLADLLKRFCAAVFLSCRREQVPELDPAYAVIVDTEEGAGPCGALLSAFRAQPDAAWLVLACDLPLMDAQTLDLLCRQRDSTGFATAFRCPHDNLPEPLAAIWEPHSYASLEAAATGHRSLRSVLAAGPVKLVEAPEPLALLNANTPGDSERVHQILCAGRTRASG